MAEMDNFSEINQNFDTIKTLLNSIRAQGILNTSDVDKLLSGINSKLEKINTEEDIDLIKIFLSELKQNFEERHGILISKFGAIESLFSNLLKNSSEMPKANDIKELFDIVATNLSVFSREVVSQKETLTDITLRIDALRSDDSDKKDIIKNITLLKPDLERLNNGFDSIVLSLNDNFKTIVKTISSLDKTDSFEKFADNLNNIEMSSNTILSALQMLDKKAEQVENALGNLATKSDIESSNRKLFELTAQSQELSALVTDISERYVRIDNLADKVDASVSIIAGLKSVLEESDEKQTSILLEQLRGLEAQLQEVSSDAKFEEFKLSLERVLKNVAETTASLDDRIIATSQEIQRIITLIGSLDINVSFQNLLSAVTKVEENVKSSINEVTQRFSTLADANVTRILNELSNDAENLTTKLNQAQSAISVLCEKNFGSVFENVTDLKKLISQIDENSVSANNAIFSSITDRLTVFENSLRDSLEAQEKTVNYSSAQLVEQIENIKNLSSVIDYKMDSSVIEVGSIKQEFGSLKKSIDEVLALDFVNTVKDLRVDLYASKQDMEKAFDATNKDLADKLTNDLYGKYESIVSKLDSVENEFKEVQAESLVGLQSVLKNISDSILDVISYVSEFKSLSTDSFDTKIVELEAYFKENSLNYVESVRDIVDVIRVQVENNLKEFDLENSKKLESVKRSISENSDDIKKEIKYSYSKLLEIQDLYNEIKETIALNNSNSVNKFDDVLASAEVVKEEFNNKILQLKDSLLEKILDFKQEFTCENNDKVSEIKFSVENLHNRNLQETSLLIENLRKNIQDISDEDRTLRVETLQKILDNLTETRAFIDLLNKNTSDNVVLKFENLSKEINQAREVLLSSDKELSADVIKRIQNTSELIQNLIELVKFSDTKSKDLIEEKVSLLVGELGAIKSFVSELGAESLKAFDEKFDLIINRAQDAQTSLIEALNKSTSDICSHVDVVKENCNNLEELIKTLKVDSEELISSKVNSILQNFEGVKSILERVDENIDGDMTRQLSIIESNFESLVSQITILFDKSNKSLADKVNEEFVSVSEELQALLLEKLELYTEKIDEGFGDLQNKSQEQSKYLQERIVDLNSSLKDSWVQQAEENNKQIEEIANQLRAVIDENIKLTAVDYVALKNKISEFASNVESNNQILTQDIKAQIDDISKYVSTTLEIQAKEYEVRQDELKLAITDDVVNNTKDLIANLEVSFDEKLINFNDKAEAFSKEEIGKLNQVLDNIVNQLTQEKQLLDSTRDLIVKALQSDIDNVSKNIEKETDIIISELIEQFDLLRKSQADDVVAIASKIEEALASYMYNNLEDMKSYLDVKTDNSVMMQKIDNLKVETSESVKNIVENLNKMLDSELFKTSISDFRVANEILINSGFENINNKIDKFKSDNDLFLEEKFALFDKKFIDTLVDKYEELKILSISYNTEIQKVQTDLTGVLSQFTEVKTAVVDKIEKLKVFVEDSLNSTKAEIRQLNESFENLRAQILNKSFDEAFQASIEKQILGLEDLVKEQLNYIEDINDLCVANLPDISELNKIVKLNVVESINNLSEKLDSNNFEADLNKVKSDLITQFISVFNQISFVAEQEEILEFIQEKHDDLISLLSRIVTTSEEISDVKDNLSLVDNKIDSLKDEIDLLNEKITAVISSDGDIDYVYSLQDLESDIANLRLALNDMNKNGQAQEFADLISSTNEIYNLVESIKNDIPDKRAFDSMAEDIESISSRTNKLLLTSDESYKTLQDNLQDFKLVINDLDERTRNFAHESGMDRIDSKLNAINTMMLNGAKTNQVFNQVFEYLAQWVDGASNQINAISDKVETLDDIGQIKVMLSDLKAEAEDNSESVELIEALGTVFDKQTKKISSIESKLDKVIVETTINNKNNKLDMKPLEETLNRFLVAMDEKLSSQQAKIDSLEEKLFEVMNSLEEKDTSGLTKKVGGMDRQIAKLNKSIEKIVSHVTEK